MNVTLFGKRVFTVVIRLRILRRDDLRYSKWALYPMTILIRESGDRLETNKREVDAEMKQLQ